MLLRYLITKLYKNFIYFIFFFENLNIKPKNIFLISIFSISFYNYIISLGIEDLPNSFWKFLIKYLILFFFICFLWIKFNDLIESYEFFFDINPNINLFNENYPHTLTFITDLYENVIFYTLYSGFDLILIYLKFNFIFFFENFKDTFLDLYFNIIFIFPFTSILAEKLTILIIIIKTPKLILIFPKLFIYPFILIFYQYLYAYTLGPEILIKSPITFYWKSKIIIFEFLLIQKYIYIIYIIIIQYINYLIILGIIIVLISQISKFNFKYLITLYINCYKKYIKKQNIQQFMNLNIININLINLILNFCFKWKLLNIINKHINKIKSIVKYFDTIWFYLLTDTHNFKFNILQFMELKNINFYNIQDFNNLAILILKFKNYFNKLLNLQQKKIIISLLILLFNYIKLLLILKLNFKNLILYYIKKYHYIKSYKFLKFYFLKTYQPKFLKFLYLYFINNKIYNIILTNNVKLYFKIYIYGNLIYIFIYILKFLYLYSKIFHHIYIFSHLKFLILGLLVFISKILPYTLLLIILDIYIIIIISLIIYINTITF